MEIVLQCLLWASIQLAATMSPGPAFIVTVKNALTYDRRTAMATAVGLAAGVGVHVTIALTGISLLISGSQILYAILKYAGAAYLIYIGVKSLWSARKKFFKKPHNAEKAAEFFAEHEPQSARIMPALHKTVLQGFLTNLLNPKALVFFTAVLAQFISPDMGAGLKTVYGLISVVTELVWFIGVSVVLTNQAIQKKFLAVMHWVDAVFGGLIVYLGIQLVSKS